MIAPFEGVIARYPTYGLPIMVEKSIRVLNRRIKEKFFSPHRRPIISWLIT